MTHEADLSRRLLEVERRLDLLFDHLRLDPSRMTGGAGTVGPGVRALLDRGDKQAAIALVREQTGMGPSEARRTVEQIMGGS